MRLPLALGAPLPLAGRALGEGRGDWLPAPAKPLMLTFSLHRASQDAVSRRAIWGEGTEGASSSGAGALRARGRFERLFELAVVLTVLAAGITVNAFCPGIIDTDMWAYNDEVWGKLLGTYKPGELMAEWIRGIPMGRAGTGEDVAGLVTFLASDDAAYITGQTINVDGGLIMS